MMLKICILTQPLRNNYGGLLQAYALQEVLKELGHNVVVDRRGDESKRWFRYILDYLVKIPFVNKYLPFSHKELSYVNNNMNLFIRENIIFEDVFMFNSKKIKVDYRGFDAFIVGSDQVWRPAYSVISNYFLDFLPNKTHIKKISYAASFGVDYSEFTNSQIINCKNLIHRFDRISVREDSGIDLCSKLFDIRPIQVLDPTFLLDKEKYIRLMSGEKKDDSSPYVISYFLDGNEEKIKVLDTVSKFLSLRTVSILPIEKLTKQNRALYKKCVLPKVSSWLRGFYDAQFIVTDSFHGTVFSLIFNKPFIVIVNKNRGTTRVKSLLKLFHLNNRLLFNASDLSSDLINEKIDFSKVNLCIKSEKSKSLNFLIESLNV